MDESRQRTVLIGVAVVVLAIVVFVLWRRAGPPTPTIPPGQTLDNPFGSAGTASGQDGQWQVPRNMPGIPPGIPPGMGPRPAAQPGGAPR